MILSRSAPKLTKAMLPSIYHWYYRVLPSLQAPCRTITTDQDRRTPLQCRGESGKQDIKLLDPFLGTWLETDKQNMEKVLDDFGVSRRMRDGILKSKSQLTYSRTGDQWSIKIGYANSPYHFTSKCKLGEMFNFIYYDGTPLKSIIRQDQSHLVVTHETIWPPLVVLTVVKEVSGDTLTSTTKLGDVSMKQVYKRRAIDLNTL